MKDNCLYKGVKFFAVTKITSEIIIDFHVLLFLRLS